MKVRIFNEAVRIDAVCRMLRESSEYRFINKNSGKWNDGIRVPGK